MYVTLYYGVQAVSDEQAREYAMGFVYDMVNNGNIDFARREDIDLHDADSFEVPSDTDPDNVFVRGENTHIAEIPAHVKAGDSWFPTD